MKLVKVAAATLNQTPLDWDGNKANISAAIAAARAKNVGWRIDYQIASPRLAGSARKASIYRDRWFSDHAPLTMDYDL